MPTVNEYVKLKNEVRELEDELVRVRAEIVSLGQPDDTPAAAKTRLKKMEDELAVLTKAFNKKIKEYTDAYEQFN